jgi:hypothetical protein
VLKAHDEAAAKIELAEMKRRIAKGEPALPSEPQQQARSDGFTVKQLAEKFCGVADELKSGYGAELRKQMRAPAD